MNLHIQIPVSTALWDSLSEAQKKKTLDAASMAAFRTFVEAALKDNEASA